MSNQQLFDWVADADELLARLAAVDGPEAQVLRQRVEASIASAKDTIKGAPVESVRASRDALDSSAIKAAAQTTARPIAARPVGLMIAISVVLALAALMAAERWRR